MRTKLTPLQRLTAYCILLTFQLLPLSNYAATITWTGGAGVWNDANNWSPNQIPTSSDDVEISSGTITLDVAAIVHSLNLSGGTVRGTETLTVTNTLTWTGGSISGSGTWTVQGTLEISGSDAKTLTQHPTSASKTLNVTGSINWTGGNINIGSKSKLSVAADASFFINHPETQTLGSTSAGIVEILGALQKNGGSTTHISGKFDVSGGNIAINNGSLNLSTSSSGTHTGSFSIANGQTLSFSTGSHNFESGSTVSGSGSLSVAGGTVTFKPGSSLGVSVSLSSGNFNDNAGLTLSSLTQTGGAFGGTGSPTLGAYQWNGGSISGSGTITVSTTLTIGSSSDKTLSSRTLNLAGTGTWTDGNINIASSGIFLVASSGDFQIAHTTDKFIGSASAGIFEIQGDATKTQNCVTTVNCSFMVTDGNLGVNTGTIRMGVSSSGLHTGNTVIGNGAFYEAPDGIHSFDALATVTGSGTLVVSGGDVVFNSGCSVSSKVNLTAGNITDEEGVTPSYYLQTSGTWQGEESPACSGDFDWGGGLISGSGIFSIAGKASFYGATRSLDTKTIRVDNEGFWEEGNFIFINDGILEVANGAVFHLDHPATEIAGGSGTFLNKGVVWKTVETISQFDIALDNQGAINGIGTLELASATNTGSVAPGMSPGTLNVNSFDNTNGTLEIEIESTAGPGTGHDLLAVSGAATLGGTLNVTLLNSFVPAVDDNYQILTCSTRSGTFSTLNLPALPSDRFWSVEYAAGDVTLKVKAASLPVELTRFNAEKLQNSVKLTWETASETNSKGFEVQRQLENGAWEPIGFVASAGSGVRQRQYEFFDKPAVKGNLYYRLRQLDNDEAETLSSIRHVFFTPLTFQKTAKAYPNPFRGELLTVELPEAINGDFNYQLMSDAGNVMKMDRLSLNGQTDKIEILTGHLSPGIYTLLLEAGETREVFRLVVH